MKYQIEFEASDLAEVIQKLSSCSDVTLLKFGPAVEEESNSRRLIGRNPRIKRPSDMKGQALDVYNLFDYDVPRNRSDIVSKFAEMYPHLQDPYNVLATIIRVLLARGFITKVSGVSRKMCKVHFD